MIFWEIKCLKMEMRSSTCASDVPTKFLKDVFDSVGPRILSIVNSCLAAGTFPSCFKLAVVQPLLKKNPAVIHLISVTLDPSLSFHFYQEKFYCFTQLTSYLNHNDIFRALAQHRISPCQISRWPPLHRRCSALIPPDLSAAFDTVDHTILIKEGKEICLASFNWRIYQMSNHFLSHAD